MLTKDILWFNTNGVIIQKWLLSIWSMGNEEFNNIETTTTTTNVQAIVNTTQSL